MQWDFLKDFESLSKRFDRLRQAARALESPNPDDDDFIKIAIVGFSMTASTERWTSAQFEIVHRYRLDDFADEMLSPMHGDLAADWALFGCLCLGYLLGRLDVGEIDERALSIGEAQIPAFMALRAGKSGGPES